MMAAFISNFAMPESNDAVTGFDPKGFGMIMVLFLI
jgi:hypothetical protein